MASTQTGRSGRLSLRDGHDVVFCHSCQNEWYQDEFGLSPCPRCGNEAVEVVTPETDPRHMYLGDEPSPRLNSRSFAGVSDYSDPEEADIDDHIRVGPEVLLRERVFGHGRTGRERDRSRTPHDHHDHDRDHLHNHDHDHAHDHHDHSHGHGHGRPGLSANDATFRHFSELLTGLGIGNMAGHPDVFTHVSTGPGIQRTTISSNGTRFSSVTWTATVGGGPSRPRPVGGAAGGEPLGFGPYANPSLPRTRPGPRITLVSASSPRADEQRRMFREMFGAMPMPTGIPSDRDDDHERGVPPLAMLLGLLNQGNGRHGDAVYTQEALDRIITALMEANPQSNAAPPASEDALSKLNRQKVDEKLLGNAGGNIECTICIEELKVGDDVAHLPCKHWFHDQCVVMWLKEHNTCPICRHPIEESGSSNQNNSNNGDPGDRAGAHPIRPGGDQGASSRGPTRPENPTFSRNLFSSTRLSPGPNGSNGIGGPHLGSLFGAGPGTSTSTRQDTQGDLPREGLRLPRLGRQSSSSSNTRPRDYRSSYRPTDAQTQAILHDSIQNLSRRAAERRQNRPRSSVHEQPTRLPSLRPRRNSLSPSSSPDPSRTRARSPSSQSRRSGVSERERDSHRDREPASRVTGWLRDHWPGGRREERRRS